MLLYMSRADERADMRKQFGKSLRSRRELLGMTQGYLAEQIDVVQTMVSNYENGAYEPPPDTVFHLERLVRAKPGELSRFFGYVPSGIRSMPKSGALDAILTDPSLDERATEAMVQLYGTLASSSTTKARPGRKANGGASKSS